MPSKPFRWTKTFRNYRTLIRARGVTYTKGVIVDACRAAAAKGGWRDSEFAATLASKLRDLSTVCDVLERKGEVLKP